jgi:hypothetical protein
LCTRGLRGETLTFLWWSLTGLAVGVNNFRTRTIFTLPIVTTIELHLTTGAPPADLQLTLPLSLIVGHSGPGRSRRIFLLFSCVNPSAICPPSSRHDSPHNPHPLPCPPPLIIPTPRSHRISDPLPPTKHQRRERRGLCGRTACLTHQISPRSTGPAHSRQAPQTVPIPQPTPNSHPTMQNPPNIPQIPTTTTTRLP